MLTQMGKYKSLEKKNKQSQQSKYSVDKALNKKTVYSSRSATSNEFAQQYAKITKELKQVMAKHTEGKNFIKSQRTRNGSKLRRKTQKPEIYHSYRQKNDIKRIIELGRKIEPNTSINDELFVHLQKEKDLKVNRNFSYIKELIAHFDNLFKVRSYLEDHKNNYELTIKSMKKYVLNYGGADINKLEFLLVQEKQKTKLKKVLNLERIFIIGVLDTLLRQRYQTLQKESTQIFAVFIGIYLYIFTYLLNEVSDPYKEKIHNIINMLDGLTYHRRKQLQSTSLYLSRKVPQIYRFNPDLQETVHQLIKDSDHHKYTLNRTFYVLLSEYAKNLNQNSELLQTNRKLLESFASCPSPYLPFSRVKSHLTLVISFEGTIALPKTQTNKLPIKIRPFASQMIKTLAELYEVIIFTYLMPQDFEEKPQIFSFCDLVLYRHHAIRIKSSFIKDLSKIGRQLNSIVMVDDRKESFPLQPDNGILVNTWRGNKKDHQLEYLCEYLKNIHSSEIKDVRKLIKGGQSKGENIFQRKKDENQAIQ